MGGVLREKWVFRAITGNDTWVIYDVVVSMESSGCVVIENLARGKWLWFFK